MHFSLASSETVEGRGTPSRAKRFVCPRESTKTKLIYVKDPKARLEPEREGRRQSGTRADAGPMKSEGL